MISPGNREHVASLLEREIGGDERSASLARLDHDRRGAEPGDDPVAGREAPRCRLDARLVLGDDEPALADSSRELGVRRRIVAVDPAAEHRNGEAAGLERAAMRLAVDAAGEAADDDEPRRGELAAEAARDVGAVRRARASADDRDGRPREQRRPPRRRAGRAAAAGRRSRAAAAGSDAARGRGRRSSLELPRRAVRQRLGDVLGRDRVGSRECCDRARHPGDARAAARRERQPVDRARREARRPPAVRGAGGRARAATIRARTGSEDSPFAEASSTARGLGTVTTRSKRSRSARESLSRNAASRCGEHEHSAAGSPRAPHGHRFIVATSWNRAGKIAAPAARAIATTPSSSGWRSASSAGRWNSGNSSRSRRRGAPGSPRRAAGPIRRRRSPPSTSCDAARGTAGARRAAARARRARRPSGCGSPRGRRRPRAAGGCPAAAARASSCRCPAGPRAAGCAFLPRRSRGPAGPARARAPPRGPAAAARRALPFRRSQWSSRSPRR